MHKTRLEAFSDGVFAVIITIMVLELRPPAGSSFHALASLTNGFLSYILSFVFVAIYWNNHHHLLHTVSHVNGRIMWANMHLLFWLSLTPVVTAWIASSHFAQVPVGTYGAVLFLCAIAYSFLSVAIIHHQGANSKLKAAIGADIKGWVSIAVYLTGIMACIWNSWVAMALYAGVAIIWFIPDRRIEKERLEVEEG